MRAFRYLRRLRTPECEFVLSNDLENSNCLLLFFNCLPPEFKINLNERQIGRMSSGNTRGIAA